MDKIIAKPLVEVGGVKFGMKRADVRKILGEATEFKKSKFSKNTTDDFGFCHVFYNTNDECEAIEIFDDIEVTVEGQVVFPTSIDSAKKVLKNLIKDEVGYTDKEQSVGIYAPSSRMESILFGEAGYYE